LLTNLLKRMVYRYNYTNSAIKGLLQKANQFFNFLIQQHVISSNRIAGRNSNGRKRQALYIL
jgi:hypothetical protein